MSDVEEVEEESRGVPAWVMTFADLMTLLMCFFVLLLAFSEMDAAKFKELSGSMKEAFGVQSEIEARTIPKGTSVIAREFSPGKPEPTAINSIRQFTIDSSENSLDAMSEESEEIKKAIEEAERLRRALREEIEKGDIAIKVDGVKVIIHILEKASFSSGSADIRKEFVSTLHKIARLIVENRGMVSVSGHTDNVPISNERFRSNWELSTSRAVSVAHQLLYAAPLDQSRFVVIGHADTRPEVDNDTAENRAKNRRVDISIAHGILKDQEHEVSVNKDATIADNGSTE